MEASPRRSSGQTEIIAVDLPRFVRYAHLELINRIESLAEWVVQHLTEKGAERYDLVGHSMVEVIVQEIARRHKEYFDLLA